MAPQRPHRRPYTPLRVVGLLLILAVAAGLVLLIRPASAGIALDPNIPHERALIDAGLSGAPGPGQPAVPVAVDRVLVDGAATYIQYCIIQPLGTVDDLSPALTDDGGTSLNAASSRFLSPPGLALPFPLPAWLPWRPMVSRRAATIIDAPLPAAARAAVLRFDGPGAHETVRVPLDLRVLAHRRLAYPNTTTRAAGLTLTLQEISFTHLIYAYAPPPTERPPSSPCVSCSTTARAIPWPWPRSGASALAVGADPPV